jgi:hypothetical protein
MHAASSDCGQYANKTSGLAPRVSQGRVVALECPKTPLLQVSDVICKLRIRMNRLQSYRRKRLLSLA